MNKYINDFILIFNNTNVKLKRKVILEKKTFRSDRCLCFLRKILFIVIKYKNKLITDIIILIHDTKHLAMFNI